MFSAQAHHIPAAHPDRRGERMLRGRQNLRSWTVGQLDGTKISPAMLWNRRPGPNGGMAQGVGQQAAGDGRVVNALWPGPNSSFVTRGFLWASGVLAQPVQ